MKAKPTNRLRHVKPIICLAGILSAVTGFAAGNTLIPPDSNTGLIVENAVIKDNTTTVLFWTYPGIGDPGAGKDCPLNFYSVALQPGLTRAEAQPVAKNVCGNGLSKARLLDNGETLLLANGRLERWRDGKNLISTPLTDQEIIKMLGTDTSAGGQTSAITADGDAVIATHVGVAMYAGSADPALMLTNLDNNGKTRWQMSIAEPGQHITLENLWAANGGSVLLRAGLLPADNSSMTMQSYLYFIDADGKQQNSVQISTSDEPDLQTLMQEAQADLQKAFASLSESNPENTRKLDASTRDDGGFDVLFQRESKVDGRAGHFLMRFAADGTVQNEQNVTEPIVPYGLDEWTDFYVDDRNLVLLSRVSASQPTVQARRKSYSQNVISIINLDSNTHVSRLVPLDQRYLEAAMNAGDEEFQYLENWPGGEPVLLTHVGGVPLAVSKGHLSRRSALRLDEGSDDLPAFTETYDQRRNDAARQTAREQRKTDRDATQAQLNADLAAAAGMSPEEFAALSNNERKQAMLNSGNYDALAEAGMKQAPAAQPSLPTGAEVQDINAQIAAAMAQAQQNLPPEMAEELNAALAQVQQEMDASGMTPPPGAPATAPTGVDESTDSGAGAFSMTVMDAFKISGRGVVLTGRVDNGTVSAGDSICLVSAKTGSRVLTVEAIEGRGLTDSATVGDMPGILVNGIEVKDVSRDDQLRSSCGNNP